MLRGMGILLTHPLNLIHREPVHSRLLPYFTQSDPVVFVGIPGFQVISFLTEFVFDVSLLFCEIRLSKGSPAFIPAIVTGYPETTYPLPLPLPSPTLAQKTPGMQYKIVDFV